MKLINSIIKKNTLVVSYEMLSDEGKVQNKSQHFSYIPENGSVDDLYDIGTSIGSILAYAPKEIRHDLSYILLEV